MNPDYVLRHLIGSAIRASVYKLVWRANARWESLSSM
jgi:hypothetical protein